MLRHWSKRQWRIMANADWFVEALQDKDMRPGIPGRKKRKTPVLHGKRRYKRRNRIEIMFGRLKDWRRAATRYERCPQTFFSAIFLASTRLLQRHCGERLGPRNGGKVNIGLGWGPGVDLSHIQAMRSRNGSDATLQLPPARFCACSCAFPYRTLTEDDGMKQRWAASRNRRLPCFGGLKAPWRRSGPRPDHCRNGCTGHCRGRAHPLSSWKRDR